MNTRRKWLVTFVIIAISLSLAACAGVLDVAPADGKKAKVDSVEVERRGGEPAEYEAVASGILPDGCTEIGDSEQEVVATTIEVTLYTVRSEAGSCPDLASRPFEETIALDVTGLPAGSYAVDVNGVVAPLLLTEDH